LPGLSPADLVYTAGAPAMTEAVARIAKAAGATCYTDPFVPETNESERSRLITRFAGWFDSHRKSPELLHAD
jgi:3-phenylpropionate/trans-cinnamate dioxygenase ferredoxin reductase subunit